ncbi:hypothetical protein D3C76_730600 [compost metagenome]
MNGKVPNIFPFEARTMHRQRTIGSNRPYVHRISPGHFRFGQIARPVRFFRPKQIGSRGFLGFLQRHVAFLYLLIQSIDKADGVL